MPDDREGTDDPLILEIRERYQHAVDSWFSAREEAKKDMRFIAGNPWEPKERKLREDNNRPCVAFDELNQYVNQLINDIRQNRRSVKVIPKGSGANDKTAELLAAIIRQIEYKSNAQSAYATAFENAASRSYGYWRVITQYLDETSFDQEIVIRRIPNPDAVYLDPDAKEADFSDMKFAFIVDPMKVKEFKRKFPKAKVTDFTSEHVQAAPLWIKESEVLVAEYWKVEVEYEKLVVEGREREVEKRTIVQYLTNGIEILEKHEWTGRWIPIVPVLGKEIYVDKGHGAERVLMSLIRLARDPYMMLCFLRSQEAEEFGMSPKAPFIGYEGQFEGHEDEWASVNKIPIPYLQVKLLTDGTGMNPLPLPQRQPFTPNIQSYEIAADSLKRAIQSAMGRYNTSVGRSDTKATSGVAIGKLNQQSDQGSYHFIDNFDRALEHNGRILLDLIPKILDTPREIGIRKPDDSFALAKVNQEVTGQNGESLTMMLSEGEHDVTISTGPSFESQREEANVFLDTLAGVQMQNTLFPRVADLAIKAKNLGPIGDEMAKRLVPPEFASKDGQEPLPPQVQQALQQAQQQIQALNAYAKQVEGELQALKAEQQAKTVELQSKERIAAMANQTQILLAEIKVLGGATETRLKAEMDALNLKLENTLAQELQESEPQEVASGG